MYFRVLFGVERSLPVTHSSRSRWRIFRAIWQILLQKGSNGTYNSILFARLRRNVGGNIRDGITGLSGSVMSKPREFAHLIKNKFGSADNINQLSSSEWNAYLLATLRLLSVYDSNLDGIQGSAHKKKRAVLIRWLFVCRFHWNATAFDNRNDLRQYKFTGMAGKKIQILTKVSEKGHLNVIGLSALFTARFSRSTHLIHP